MISSAMKIEDLIILKVSKTPRFAEGSNYTISVHLGTTHRSCLLKLPKKVRGHSYASPTILDHLKPVLLVEALIFGHLNVSESSRQVIKMENGVLSVLVVSGSCFIWLSNCLSPFLYA